jgi:uncharacterized protein YabN with tetrapyrrole methylase and pyrophosphatase domain
MNTRKENLQAFSRLLDIMDELREKCPWDKKQTLQSLKNNTIEETYELVDAIQNNDLKLQIITTAALVVNTISCCGSRSSSSSRNFLFMMLNTGLR